MDQKIIDLKQMVEKYNQLSDYEKIQNIGMYNEIMNCKKECLDSLKNLQNNNNNDNISITCTDDEFMESMNAIQIIKQQMENDNSIITLCESASQLNRHKSKIEAYLKLKKMEIIHIS